MIRLPFQLPDSTRVAWASGEARAVWEPRVQKIGAAWERIERLAVGRFREAALQAVPPSKLPELAAWAAGEGLAAAPLVLEGVADGYSQTPVPLAEGRPWRYRVVVARPAEAARFAGAWAAENDEEVGALLGYPACCRGFFRRVWRDERLIDTTWHMAADGTDGPAEANILLRWLGIRAVPHLPCSFACLATAEFGSALLGLGEAAGHAEEMGWLREMLAWPAEWSALHGLAVITTPVCRIVTRTDATADLLVVQRAGASYPAEGASGVVFPYRPGPHAKPLRPAAPRREIPQRIRPRPWEENGFATRAAETAAHGLVLEAVAGLAFPGAVVDLGCGNGALVSRVAAAVGGTPCGVEIEPGRAASAAKRIETACGPLTGPWPLPPEYRLALFMPGRLLELEAPEARRLRLRLARSCDAVLLYAYADWLERHGGLGSLAQAAGFGDANSWAWGRLVRGDGAEAFVARSVLRATARAPQGAPQRPSSDARTAPASVATGSPE